MIKRIHNFSAGPGALPQPVLEQIQEELVDFRGEGMSIMEMSHRGKVVDTMYHETVEDLRTLIGINDDYDLIFMGGGARTQFALVPMNLLSKDSHAEYLVTGTWSEGALNDAKKLGDARTLYDSKESGHNHVPTHSQYTADPKAAYLHYTSNNTIFGTQFHDVPQTHAPLVCDMSSDILSHPFDVSKYGLIYAGAQKNMGPAGVTLLIIRKDLLERSSESLPEMFSFAKIAAKSSMLNTPPVFPIYVVGLVAKYLLKTGGLPAMGKQNETKSKRLYDAIDNSQGFYTPHAQPTSRSHMNVTFRLPNEELEAIFVKEAQGRDLSGLKGHRSVGGIRASLYNAVLPESVDALLSFMEEFRAKHG